MTDTMTEAAALAAAALVASVQSAPTQDSPVADAADESSTDTAADTHASEGPQGEPAPATAEPAPATAESAKKKDRRGRRVSGPRRAAAAAAPTDRPLPAAAPVGRRRILHKGRTIGAVLAIATLVGGTALPALGLGQTGGATAAATASLADAQSLTVDSEALPKVEIRGDFSATTPAELAEIQAVAAAAARSGVNPIAKPGQVIIPMAEGSYTMTDGYGASRPGRSHMGQDYAAPIGTPIYAAADGVVTMSQDSYGGYGVTVQVKHDQLGSNAVSTLYGHMDYDTRAVDVGEHVVAGQFLGRVGNTGYTIGSCLHFEVRISGSPIDPVPWLKANVR